jgi:hypothetical protein
MLYQLPNGKVIEISTEQYIEMTDEELEYLIAYNYGEVLENPWFGSVLLKQPPSESSIRPDLTESNDDDKASDSDIDFDPERD